MFLRSFLVGMFLVCLLGGVCELFAQEPEPDEAPPEETPPAPKPEKTSGGEEAKPDGQQEDEVVVTATRMETPTRQVGSSITVITRQQLEQMKKTTVLEALRSVPGLDVTQSGSRGTTGSVFIRGAKSDHTLVLIDGVEMNDPINPGRSFDFGNLTTDNIERIEILRGPQSTLYGSDAIGGVIHIFTRRGKGKPGGWVSFESGSFSTYRERVGVHGGNRLFHYSLGASREDTKSISAANSKLGNHEKDGYGASSFSARVGVTPTEYFSLDLILRYVNAKVDNDVTGGVGGDDPNKSADTEQYFFRTEARLSLFDDLWEQKLGFSLTDNDRDNDNATDPAHPSSLDRQSYDARIVKFDWQHNLYIHETNTLTLGLEREVEKGESDFYSESQFGPFISTFERETARTNSFYAQDQLKLWKRWFTTFGVRFDDHDRFGTEATYRIASSYLLRKTGTRFKGSFGTGFKAPTLFQLFSSFGELTLEPEESEGWDVGVEQSFWGEKLTLGATYFENDFENLINFDSGTSKFVNVDRAKTEGVELFLSARPIDELTLRLSYTYTDTRDEETGLDLLRRAKRKFAFGLNYRFLEKGNVNVEVLYVGRRFDQDFSTFPAERVSPNGHVLLNLAASYDITEHFQVFGRAENLLDEDYEEVFGFGTPGPSAYAGIKISF